jgi:hypothetical protein
MLDVARVSVSAIVWVCEVAMVKTNDAKASAD